MWTKQQVAALQRAKAACKNCRPGVEMLEEIAKHAPQFQDRAEQLRSMLEVTEQICDTCLRADPVGK